MSLDWHKLQVAQLKERGEAMLRKDRFNMAMYYVGQRGFDELSTREKLMAAKFERKKEWIREFPALIISGKMTFEQVKGIIAQSVLGFSEIEIAEILNQIQKKIDVFTARSREL